MSSAPLTELPSQWLGQAVWGGGPEPVMKCWARGWFQFLRPAAVRVFIPRGNSNGLSLLDLSTFNRHFTGWVTIKFERLFFFKHWHHSVRHLWCQLLSRASPSSAELAAFCCDCRRVLKHVSKSYTTFCELYAKVLGKLWGWFTRSNPCRWMTRANCMRMSQVKVVPSESALVP